MTKRVSWAGGLVVVLFALLGALLVKNVAAGPANSVRPGDVAKAARQSVGDGGVDVREPLAESGLVAGNGVVEPVALNTALSASA